MYRRGSTERLPEAQAATVEFMLSGMQVTRPPVTSLDDVISSSWRSQAMARFAVQMLAVVAGQSRAGDVENKADGQVCCSLEDHRGRPTELLLTFESPTSGRITRVGLRPVLQDGVEVRPPRAEDLPAMRELDLAAPVLREDGTEVTIDRRGQQFESHRVLSDHRWLAAFLDGRMIAVQGLALVSAPIGDTMCRIAYNHYSRSDPRTRGAGNHIYLLATLYREVFPEIDQFLSVVDVQNPAGLRLSFGLPWPTRVQRLFLSIPALAARRDASPPRRTFDPARAAALLNATHAGMHLWVPRTPEFLVQREQRAPAIYRPRCWRLTDHAALALWPSGERRIYRKDGKETARTLALALDYGFSGDAGRQELTGLLCEAARELRGQDFSHIALFVSEDHPATQWISDLAEARDIYAGCAAPLEHPPAPEGPVYADQILF